MASHIEDRNADNGDDEDDEASCVTIDYQMIPSKIACYLLFSGVGCIARFSNISLVVPTDHPKTNPCHVQASATGFVHRQGTA